MKKLTIFYILLFIVSSCSSRIIKENDYNNKSIKVFIQTHNRNIDNSKIENIISSTNKYSIEYNIDPKLIISLIARESSFRDNIVSKSGAIGLGQLLITTAKDLGVNNPYSIDDNIKGTIKYLKRMLILCNNDIELALASYKMGYYSVNKIGKYNLPQSTNNYINDIKNYYKIISDLSNN